MPPKKKPDTDPFAEEDDDIDSGADEDSEPEIDLSEAEPEISIGEDDDERPSPSRQERRRARFNDVKERAERAEREAEEAKRRLNDLEQRASQYPDPRQLQAYLLGNQRGNQPDPIDAELKNVYQQQTQLADVWNARRSAGNLTPAEQNEMIERARDLDEKRVDLLNRRTLMRTGVGQVDPDAIHKQVLHAQIRQRHGDVYANQRQLQYADGEYQRLRALGEPDSMDTLDRAMDAARKRFGQQAKYTRHREPPSSSERARFTGTTSGGGGNKPASERKTLKLTPELKQMADAALSHIKDERARYQQFANTVGKKMLARQR
jgi:hypothetical protein